MGQIGWHGILIACHCHQVDVDGVLIMVNRHHRCEWLSEFACSACLSQSVALTTGKNLLIAEENNG